MTVYNSSMQWRLSLKVVALWRAKTFSQTGSSVLVKRNTAQGSKSTEFREKMQILRKQKNIKTHISIATLLQRKYKPEDSSMQTVRRTGTHLRTENFTHLRTK